MCTLWGSMKFAVGMWERQTRHPEALRVQAQSSYYAAIWSPLKIEAIIPVVQEEGELLMDWNNDPHFLSLSAGTNQVCTRQGVPHGWVGAAS